MNEIKKHYNKTATIRDYQKILSEYCTDNGKPSPTLEQTEFILSIPNAIHYALEHLEKKHNITFLIKNELIIRVI